MSKALVLKGTDFSVNKLDTVIVTDPVPCTGITLSASTASVEAGKTFTLTATVTPNDTTDNVVWSSSDTTKATVENGIVTGVGKGNATITATCGNYSASCTITVIAYYQEFHLGWFYTTDTAIEFRAPYQYAAGAVYNDPFLRKVRNGQVVKLNRVGSAPSGMYVYIYVFSNGVFTDKCYADGDNYILTQETLDRQSANTVSVLNTSTKLAEIKGYVSGWTSEKDYVATQDCYIAICTNRDGITDLTDSLDAMAEVIQITVE